MYAVALCVDANYLAPALVTLISLAATVACPERSDIAVAITCTDITGPQAATTRDLVRHLGFKTCSIRNTAPPVGARIHHGDYITPATYLRFGITRDELDRSHVVYLDADLIVLADPAEAFDLLPPGQIGVVRDEIVQAVGRDHALPGYVDTHPHHYGLPYYNAGAIWMATDDLDDFRTGSLDQLRRSRRYIYFNDQDALNLWLLRTRRAAQLPGSYNRFELGRFRERSDWINRATGRPRPLADAKIVHFIGSHKPWLRSCPSTEAVRTYRELLGDLRRALRRLGDLVLDTPTARTS